MSIPPKWSKHRECLPSKRDNYVIRIFRANAGGIEEGAVGGFEKVDKIPLPQTDVGCCTALMTEAIITANLDIQYPYSIEYLHTSAVHQNMDVSMLIQKKITHKRYSSLFIFKRTCEWESINACGNKNERERKKKAD